MGKANKSMDVSIGLSDEKKWDAEKLSRIETLIKQESEKQSEERVLRNNMLAVQYEIEDYLGSENISLDETLEIGHFVEMYLDEMNLTKKRFANIMGLQPSNLHKYLTGSRKLNADLALKFSHFFHTSPEMWIMIQAKNEITHVKFEKAKTSKYKKYDYKRVLDSYTKTGKKVISRRDELIEKYAADIETKFGETVDMDLLTKITFGLGPSIYNSNSSKVSGSDIKELETVKNNYLIKKLGMRDNPQLIKGIKEVIEKYGQSNRNKYRAVVYYMLAKELKKETVYQD